MGAQRVSREGRGSLRGLVGARGGSRGVPGRTFGRFWLPFRDPFGVKFRFFGVPFFDENPGIVLEGFWMVFLSF